MIPKRSRAALILLGDYEFHGTFMTTGSFDVLPTLREEPTSFFPLTAVRLQRVTGADTPMAAAVALLNAQKTTLLHLERHALACAPRAAKRH